MSKSTFTTKYFSCNLLEDAGHGDGLGKGTTSVVPPQTGFGKGTTSVVPLNCQHDPRFSAWGSLLTVEMTVARYTHLDPTALPDPTRAEAYNPYSNNPTALPSLRQALGIRRHTGVSLTSRDESNFSYAIIRHNVRTYESGGVVQVVRGKNSAETTVKQFEDGQSSEDRHAGWRYFPEKTEIKPGTNAAEATHKRQAELETRERKAQEDIDAAAPAPKAH